MAIRPIYGNSVEDLQRLVRDLNDELTQLRSGNNRGQRQTSAADAVQPDDLVTKRQLEVVVDRLRQVENLPRAKKTRGGGSSSTGGGGTNPGDLPRATHYMDFWYYFGKTRYQEIKPWTTAYWVGAGEDADEDPPDVWIPIMADRLRTAALDGKRLLIEWDCTSEQWSTEFMLQAVEMAGVDLVWPLVNLLMPFDEPGGTVDDIEAQLADVRAEIRARNLPIPWIGSAFTRNQIRQGSLTAAQGLNVVGIEGYIDPPGDPNATVKVTALNNWVQEAKLLVPGDKKLLFIIQAYNRNGAWVNEDTLLALQTPMYMYAFDDPRVVSIGMFAYDRYNAAANSKGTRELGSRFTAEHQRIYSALTGQSTALGCRKVGSRGLLEDFYVSAYDICISEQINVLFETRDGITYVIAGQEAAAKAALIEVLLRPQFSLEVINSPVPPYDVNALTMKAAGSVEFSETYVFMTSWNQIRLSGAYVQTCRPAQF